MMSATRTQPLAMLVAVGVCAIHARGARAGEAPLPLPAWQPAVAQPAPDAGNERVVPSYTGRPGMVITARVETAAMFMWIYDIPITGGEVTLGLGFDFHGPIGLNINVIVADGLQKTGLNATHAKIGADFVVRPGRFRLAIGGNIGFLNLAQAVTDTRYEGSLSLGAEARISFDLYRWGNWQESALFLAAKISVDLIGGDANDNASTEIWGPTFGLGVRL